MRGNVVKVMAYGTEVSANEFTESLRREECLCLNCYRMRPEDPEHCTYAADLYRVCRAGNIALCVTRCKRFSAKEVPAVEDAHQD